MAIFPPGDLVLDVLRAADPARASRTVERLRVAEAARGVTVAAAGLAERPAFRIDESTRPAAATPATSAPRRAADPLRDFESLLLRGAIEALLPPAKGVTFGQGAGGHVWRSFYAETLADSLAASGTLRIAGKLAGAVGQRSESAAVENPRRAGLAT